MMTGPDGNVRACFFRGALPHRGAHAPPRVPARALAVRRVDRQTDARSPRDRRASAELLPTQSLGSRWFSEARCFNPMRPISHPQRAGVRRGTRQEPRPRVENEKPCRSRSPFQRPCHSLFIGCLGRPVIVALRNGGDFLPHPAASRFPPHSPKRFAFPAFHSAARSWSDLPVASCQSFSEYFPSRAAALSFWMKSLSWVATTQSRKFAVTR